MSRTRRWTLLLLLLFAGLLATAAGCRSKEPEKLVVLCGRSFRPPMEKLAQMFEDETGVPVELVWGNSEELLPNVVKHAMGDVFVAHDPFMQDTEDADALLRYVTVGYLAPSLVVKKGNPQGIQSIDDLARPGLGVVLMNPEYAECGKMTDALLEKKGIKEAVHKNVGNAIMRSHDEVATQIKLGHRDAGIMWNGMAHNWLADIEIVPTPYEYDKEVRVGVMGLSYSPKKELIEKFLTFAQRRGRKIFKEFGYVKSVQPGKEAEDDPLWDNEVEAAQPLLLYCGAGIRPPVAELAELLQSEYGIAVQADYGGSEKLLSRIKLVKQGDLYMPGDMHYIDKAQEAGLLAAQRTACYFVPVILVQKGNPHNIGTLRDLLRPGLKIGLGDPKACAVGHVSAEIFAKNGIAEDDLEANVKYRSATVNDLGNHIKLKSLDAVIVWDAVAAYYAGAAEVVPIPPEQNVIATVSMAVLKSSQQPELAGKVAAFFASRRGTEVFRKHHYTVTPPK